MGSMICNRRDCGNAMCERYSSEHGYICTACFEELVMLGAAYDVNEFMNSKAQEHDGGFFASVKWDRVFPETK